MTDREQREKDRREHVASEQPLAHLFTVSFDEVRRRVSSGSKWADRPQPKGRGRR